MRSDERIHTRNPTRKFYSSQKNFFFKLLSLLYININKKTAFFKIKYKKY